MASDQHMIETLSGMLQHKETLLHPIFGYVQYNGFSQFAYFCFTETHFLIAYLTTGNIVTDIERIPLDIKSIKIKKTKILNEYKIHILFENKKTLEIFAFLKVLKIKSQKDNLPLFLQYLKNKSKNQKKLLKEIDGKKIRWQYFNTYIFMMLVCMPVIDVMIIMGELRKGNFDIWNIIAEMSGATPVILVIYGIFIGPFVILSVFNRFSFGKIVGVLTKDILFLENLEIPITDIKKIIYHPSIMSRHNIRFSYVMIFVRTKANNMEPHDVLHFPLYGLMKIKNYNKEIKLSFDKYTWFLIFCPTVIGAIMGFLLG